LFLVRKVNAVVVNKAGKRIDMIQNFHNALGNRVFNDLINISFKDRYVFFKNPKVASSSVGVTLARHEARTLHKPKTAPHMPVENSVFVKPYQLPATTLMPILNGDDFFRFTFVRNPYARLVSAYKDKIQNNEPEKLSILRVMAKNAGQDDTDLDVETEISFEQFIDAVVSCDPRQLDVHWKPQVVVTMARWVTHHFVGKFERLDEHLSKLELITGVPVASNLIVHTPHKTDTKSTWRDMYTDALAQKVGDYYANDFSTFQYKANSWKQ
jgi:hypothetical protein